MKKFRLIVFGFLLGAATMFVVMPELSFEEHTIDLWHPDAVVSSSAAARTDALVTKVVDGDTIDVQFSDTTKARVRFVGIDTPETVDPRKSVQCFGPEASAHMKALLSGQHVTLEAKPDEDKDKYGRLLRYVFLDGKDIGASMLADGYAVSLCKSFPHPRCVEYDALEQNAQSEHLGRWSACAK